MRVVAAVLLLVVCGGCGGRSGDGEEGFVWYGLGDPANARARAEPQPEDPRGNRTLRDLAEDSTITTFDVSLHILMGLKDDGTFVYYGPLKMGDDQTRIEGTWARAGSVVTLNLAPPRESKGVLVAALECFLHEGVLEYPLGRDPINPVFYGLRDLRLGAFPHPTIRVGPPPR